jgi:Zn-dependent protease
LGLREAVIGLIVLLVSVIIHENAHGWTALALGDDTAKNAKRLTLNPIRHLDIVGSVVLPLVLYFSTNTMFGYAKPVPVNPAKLRGKDRWGFAVVALAGPASNLVLAFIAGIAAKRSGIPFIRDLPVGIEFRNASILQTVLLYAFLWNLLLAAFNLLPIPPLDGSRLLRLVLNANGRRTLDRIEPYGFVILLVLIVWLDRPLFAVVDAIRSGLVRLLPL